MGTVPRLWLFFFFFFCACACVCQRIQRLCQLSVMLKPGDAAQSYRPVFINGSPGNSVRCVSQWSSEGRAGHCGRTLPAGNRGKRMGWGVIKLTRNNGITELFAVEDSFKLYLFVLFICSTCKHKTLQTRATFIDLLCSVWMDWKHEWLQQSKQ